MKDTESFKLLGGIDPEYLDEALNYKAKRKSAVILRVVLPAAALVAVLTVFLAVGLPMLGKSPSPAVTGALQPLDTPAGDTTPIADIHDELVFHHVEDHLEVTDIIGTGGTVVVPDAVNGLPVTHVKLNHLEDKPVSEVTVKGEHLVSIEVPANQKITLNIGADVHSVGQSLLRSASVKAIEVDPANPVYASFCGMLYTKDYKTLVACPAGYESSRVTFDPENSLADAGDAMLLPAQLTAVGQRAFEGCTSIVSLVLPDRLLTVGNAALSGCTSLRSLSLPGGVSSLPRDLLSDCPIDRLLYRGTSEAFASLKLILENGTSILFAPAGNADGELAARIVSFYTEAEEVYSWFTRFNMIACDAGTVVDGCCKVVYPGISSRLDLLAYAARYFDGETVASLADNLFDTYFAELDGELCVRCQTVPADYNADARSYSVTDNGDGSYTLTVCSAVPGLPFDTWTLTRCTITETAQGLRIMQRFTLPAETWYSLYLIETLD